MTTKLLSSSLLQDLQNAINKELPNLVDVKSGVHVNTKEGVLIVALDLIIRKKGYVGFKFGIQIRGKNENELVQDFIDHIDNLWSWNPMIGSEYEKDY